MSERNKRLSKDGVSKPESFDMDAPVPDDLGVENLWLLHDWTASFWWINPFFVPEDAPDYFIQDGKLYATYPYNPDGDWGWN